MGERELMTYSVIEDVVDARNRSRDMGMFRDMVEGLAGDYEELRDMVQPIANASAVQFKVKTKTGISTSYSWIKPDVCG